jgi:hypothetical protein
VNKLVHESGLLSPQPKDRSVNVKQTMCRIRTGRFFPAIRAGLSITCAAAQARAASVEQAFAGSLTATRKTSAGIPSLRPGAGL